MLITLLLLLIIVLGLISISIVWPALKRALAKIPLFYVEVPENHAVLIMKDMRLVKTLIAPSPELLPAFETLALVKPTIEIVEGGLQWLGWPWQGYEILQWYETSKDDNDPNCRPNLSIYLGDQALDYPEVSHKVAEGAKIITDLVVFIRTVDPEKALLAVKHRKDAIRQKIESAWREILVEFPIFQGGNIRDKKFGINPQVFKDARNKLEVYIGLRNGKRPKKFIDENNRTIVEVIEQDWGQKIISVSVENFRFDDVVEQSLSEVVKARAGALAKIEEAEGKKIAERKAGEAVQQQLKIIADEIKSQATGLDENAKVALAAKLIIERGYQNAVKEIDNAYLIDGLRGLLGSDDGWINKLLGNLRQGP